MASLDNTIGLLFDAVAWFYFRTYLRRDSWWIKSLVAFVILCDTCQQAILTVYSYVIKNFGNPAILDHVFSTLIIEIFFSDFIAIAVQLFYCYRVYRLSKGNWIACGSLAILSLGSFRLDSFTRRLKIQTYTELATLKTLSMTCNIAAAVTDALISVVLVYYLYISKTGFGKTDDMINRLPNSIHAWLIHTFGAGLPTSFCALAACISISAWPQTFIYIFWFLLLYTNTLLVTLNTRDYIRSISAPGTMQDIHLTRQTSGQPTQGSDAIAIRIDTTSDTQRDFDRKIPDGSERSVTRE
ncbi:hypothetical protein B0H13DRAFT_2009979 [Mycena leptocephala]|nr:hypothetical protein B0H13DRAFT_2009979 [Mycena leptocephala]